jgi:transposase-like protein
MKGAIIMDMIGKVKRVHRRDKKTWREIARATGLSRNTMAKWLNEAQPVEPKWRRDTAKATKLSANEAALTRPKKERRGTLDGACASSMIPIQGGTTERALCCDEHIHSGRLRRISQKAEHEAEKAPEIPNASLDVLCRCGTCDVVTRRKQAKSHARAQGDLSESNRYSAHDARSI